MRLGSAACSIRPSVPYSVVVALGMLIGFPTVSAYQDMASLVSGIESSGARWNGFVEQAVAGSVQSADMPFVDAGITGSLSGAGLDAPGIGSVAFRSKAAAANTVPDEDRVVRRDKRARIVGVARVAPPKAFNAGSVLERSSYLLRSTFDADVGDSCQCPFSGPPSNEAKQASESKRGQHSQSIEPSRRGNGSKSCESASPASTRRCNSRPLLSISGKTSYCDRPIRSASCNP